MALGTLTELIKHRLPFLAIADDNTISSFMLEAFYFFQSDLNKTDNDVEDQSKYNPLEKSFLADYIAYDLVTRKSIQTSGGTEGEAGQSTLLKRAKADVVEAEFMQVKASDGSLIMMSTEKYLAELIKKMCPKARKLNIELELCNSGDTGESSFAPLLYVQTTC